MNRSTTGEMAAWLLACACIVGGGMYGMVSVAQSAEKVIRVTAKRFSYSPDTIALRKGEPVTLEFTTEDVLMGFNLPDLGVRADIVPGKVTRVHFVPDRAGTFVFLCDVFCGAGHETMNGKVVVTDN